MQKLTLFLLLFTSTITFSQEKIALKVYSFKEIEKLQQQNPKPIVVSIYTDWCKFCHGMEKNTFQNKKVTQALNENFYFIKLNAEEKKDITFLGKTFKYKPSGNKTGIHELAKELALKKGKIRYPTTIFLNKKFEINLQLDSYIRSKEMNRILKKYIDNF